MADVNPTIAVEGLAADGTAVLGNPVPVGGTDGTNVQTISTTTAGEIKVQLVAGTANAGDVDVLSLPGGITGFAEDAAATGGDVGLPVLGVRNDAAASKTGADGDYSMLATDAAGRVGVADLGGSISVDDNGGSLTVDVTGSVDTELPAAAALADNTSTPTAPAVGAFGMGYDGTNWDMVRVANGGRLQVDVVTGGGSDSPTTPTTDRAESTNTAANGGTSNLDSADLGGNTRKLWQVDVGASVTARWDIHAHENGSSVKHYTTLFTRAGESASWRPPHRDFASRAFAANAGFDGFRVVGTNLDRTDAANLAVAFHYSA